MKPQVEGSELGSRREVIDCCGFFCSFNSSEVERELIKDKDSYSECYIACGLSGLLS